MRRRTLAAPPRKGVILLVVLSLLTLFAIVGISFVLYADSAAASARIATGTESVSRPDVEPEVAMAYFMQQLLFDVNDDESGIGSALRGHSLSRSMFGYKNSVSGNSYVQTAAADLNNRPFVGLGRMHFVHPAGTLLASQDDYQLVNYTYHRADNFLRDPERYGTRPAPRLAGAADNRRPWAGGYNAPYTYPDLNNMYLGAMRADGVVLAHSFHRLYTGFGSLDPLNPNWASPDPTMKYRVLRPRPAEMGPGFPLPEDAGGDVKNVIGSPGYFDPVSGKFCNNDSFWMDLGAPVMTSADGRKFKMLFAPFLVDLDGRVNVNVHGNIRGTSGAGLPGHASNQGWGLWEVNLGPIVDGTGANRGVLSASVGGAPEWVNLFRGLTKGTAVALPGRYGVDQLPTRPSEPANLGIPHFYAQTDFDGCISPAVGTGFGGGVSPKWALPAAGAAPFPTFPTPGWDNGTNTGPAAALPTHAERSLHPFRYNVVTPVLPATLTPTQYDRAFPTSEMERLLRFKDTGAPALVSDLERLLPKNFNDTTNATTVAESYRRRNLVTTLSADRDVPGISPWLWNPVLYPYRMSTTPGDPFPFGDAVVSPPAPLAAPPAGGDFAASWRRENAPYVDYDALGATAATPRRSFVPQNALTRTDLARALTNYPGEGNPGTPLLRHDAAGNQAGFENAHSQRQRFANSIYRRLLAVAGVPPIPAGGGVGQQGNPNEAQLAPRRWLAQLAVNIVDYLDSDDISTPLNFYNAQDGLPDSPASAGNSIDRLTSVGGTPNPELPRYWVFGTELPNVVINEVLVEAEDLDLSVTPNPQLRTWVELTNSMPSPGTVTNPRVNTGYSLPAPLQMSTGAPYPIYRVVLTNRLLDRPTNDNVLGAPQDIRGGTTATDFDAQARRINGTLQPASAAGWYSGYSRPHVLPRNYTETTPSGQGFFLLGPPQPPPPDPKAADFRDPFVNGGQAPGTTPVVRSTGFRFNYDDKLDSVKAGMTVLLRRLSNPHLPFNDKPGIVGTVKIPTTVPDPADPTMTITILVDETRVIPNPYYNPYVTVDYAERVPFRDMKNIPGDGHPSRGKTQPYAARTALTDPTDATTITGTSPVKDQTVQDKARELLHTFGLANAPVPATNAPDWLVHLDRRPISPMEILHASAFPPYQLTQQFMLQDLDATARAANPAAVFAHRAPWFDETRRVYRVFELLRTHELATGAPTAETAARRIPGLININTIWDEETFQAVVSANGSNLLSDPVEVKKIYDAMVADRSPGSYPGPVNLTSAQLTAVNAGLGLTPPAALQPNRPFLGMAAGYSAQGGQYANAQGIGDTLLRPRIVGGLPDPSRRMFQNPADVPGATHPYQQTELLTKIYGRLTTRSNVFAVWVTVGFFEVVDGTENDNPPKLGREIGREEGRHVRHRMFAVVDRSRWATRPATPARFDPRGNVNLVPHFSLID